MSAKLISIQVGLPKRMGTPNAPDPMDRPWYSAFYKHPVAGPVRLNTRGLVGDGQADRRIHGLPEMAALCYAAAHYDRWREELGRDDIGPGGFGENFTFLGADETTVCIGDVYSLGDAVVQVTQPRQPCSKLAKRWRMKDLPTRVIANGRCGWYVKVLTEGTVAAGDALILTDRPHTKWTIAAVNDRYYRGHDDLASAQELADLTTLSRSWRRSFAERLSN